jgi:hypothetical protein
MIDQVIGYSLARRDRTCERPRSATSCNDITKPHQCLRPLLRPIEQILLGTPFAGLTEQDNGRSSEAENCLFVAPLERLVDVVLLHDAAHRERSDFDHAEPAEMPGFKHLDAAFVAEQEGWLRRAFVFTVQVLAPMRSVSSVMPSST